MPAQDSMPAGQDPDDAWWAAREAAYRQRPEIKQETGRLRAEARERAQEDYDRAARLEQRIEDGVPRAQEALDEEMTRQAIEDDPPEPSARDDPDEWRAFFRWKYGRDMPLNAAYQAEAHSIGRAAPPDAGGLAAAYYEVSYPRGFDEIEPQAERAGVTADEIRRRRELPGVGSQQDPETTGEPAHLVSPGKQTRSALAAEIAVRGELASDGEYAARARHARDEAVSRSGLDPDQADAGYLADLHRTAGAAASRIIGCRPAVADAGQIIAGLSRQRPASARPPRSGSPAALAALSFPGPVSQAATAAPAPARREAATGIRRHLGGPRH